MDQTLFRVRIRVAVVLVVTILAAACRNANPLSPSHLALSSGGTAAAIASLPSLGSNANRAIQPTGHPSAADLQNRGWTCLEPPISDPPTVCSQPNQGFPAVSDPLPADRPASFTFWIFRDGRFVGTELLIRSDLYQRQICESTGEPYFFAELIGYYECIHTPGR
jgi:hypothetical protein